MINKEENQQNLNINFKLKLIKKPDTYWKTKVAEGIYQQLKTGHKYDYSSFNVEDLKDAIGEMFYGKK
jgi:hypothetical protein